MKPNTIVAIFLAVVGFLLALGGIIWYEIDRRSGQDISVWAYLLMISGVIIVIIALILITYFFYQNSQNTA